MEKPTFNISLPTRTKVTYLLLGLLCLMVSGFHILDLNLIEENIINTHGVLDIITSIVFLVLGFTFFFRLSKRLKVYNDKVERISLLGKKVSLFKDMNGHHVDDSLSNTLGDVRGYFRGIIIKMKDGSHFSLNRAELTEFDALKKHFRSRCRYFNNKSIKKLLRKEDQKLYLVLVILLIILIASLLH